MHDAPDRHGSPATSVGGTQTVSCDLQISDTGLTISEVRVSPRSEEKLKAFVSITLNSCFVIRGIKIIEGRERLFVAMPSRQKSDGTFQDIVHPINSTTRKRLEENVLSIYYDVMEGRNIP